MSPEEARGINFRKYVRLPLVSFEFYMAQTGHVDVPLEKLLELIPEARVLDLGRPYGSEAETPE